MNQDHRPRRGRYPLRLRRRPVPWQRQRPTWREARPAVIAGALERALARPSGNWYVVGAATDVHPAGPLAATVAGLEVVVRRDARGRLVAGPGACPHLGAPLADSPVRCGTLVCHWHGLALDGTPFAGWEPPLGPDDRGRPRTTVTEALLATSDRPGFPVARRLAPVLRPLMPAAAGRLWRDDLAYAERRRDLRRRGLFPG
ncbi:Rieske (2Fe-2S) protein [Streptomyces flaveolus]|uniref:Rieske (2Fe-2S) protein n=1 Tax=Streptomyces flaveolus TaxID=67297 RepID=UPI0036FD17AA